MARLHGTSTEHCVSLIWVSESARHLSRNTGIILDAINGGTVTETSDKRTAFAGVTTAQGKDIEWY